MAPGIWGNPGAEKAGGRAPSSGAPPAWTTGNGAGAAAGTCWITMIGATTGAAVGAADGSRFVAAAGAPDGGSEARPPPGAAGTTSRTASAS